ncbi:MAG TPA: D-glycero-beta-D-manno-heptose-7-phosphate kinase [Nitrospirae bacterium]|nr:D-glycero-beta-D-manno-heptose-7-phosphate kinase [Nitrospirota bacterium]
MRYSGIFKNFRKKNILVVGDMILDHYIWGLVERISPEAPVPVIDVKDENYTLGGAANVAANIAALGGKATVVGVRGDDMPGEVLQSLLNERGIDTSGLFRGKRPTTIKTRVIAHSQQVVRFDREERSGLDDGLSRKIRDFLSSETDSWDALIVSDYKKGVVSDKLMRLIAKGYKKQGTFVSVDPKVGHFDFYKGVSLVTPNTKEASEGTGIEITDEGSLIEAGETLLRRLRCDAVLITRGEHGMTLFERGPSVSHIPTAARGAYDVTGAGDTVIATITLAHVSGADLRSAAVISNHAAGVVVGQVGTATVTPEQILQSMKSDGRP